MKETEHKPYVALGELIDIVDGLWYAVDEDGRQAIATCVSDIPEGFGEPRPLTDSRDDALWYDETAAVRHASTLPELFAALASLGDELDGFRWAFCTPEARRCFYFMSIANGAEKND